MTQETFTVVTVPAIEACPECESHHLSGVELQHGDVDISLDGEGGIAHYEEGTLYQMYLIELECFDCEAVLIEDGEIIHEEIGE